ncbi:energy-coupling factor transporter transmembrane component T family protein [Paenibacillus ihuae]|uniref:energy-coupling factor transporter transmembrane component T family protein n=1 Tax=Paenibacillus ihuae TaxID=1232431 RepID=UPI0006D56F9F|nr:energy-coupling factor transporter transmembrane component T [Paenibacillus ihuae]
MKFTGYVHKSSFLHRIEPRVKIIWFVIMTVMVVLYKNLFVLTLFLAGCALLWLISDLGREMTGMLKRLLPMLIMAFLTWLIIGCFQNNDGTVIWQMGPFALEDKDLLKSVVASIRIFLMVSVFYTLIMTTNFSEIIYGLQKLGVPFKVAFMCGLVFQIIPLMISEFQTIADAQRARGLELDKGGMVSRLRCYSVILFPLFIRAIQSGQSISLSMHIYNLNFKQKRSSYKTFRVSAMDLQFFVCFTLMWAAAVYLGIQFPILKA